ncbi:MAG: response regulator [Armatimonadetes bacterium]|nr:response regulator [Armatimonadota bacterium]
MARILLIDDEANIRMMVRLALEQSKHTVEMAADGPEGLEKFGDGGWDLVLLDQRMPGMEGLDVLREMRRRAPQARVILITAFGTVDLVLDAQQAGATDFLRKPFTIQALRGAVQAALDGPPPVPEENPYYPEPEPAEPPRRTPPTYSAMTLNGFRIEFQPLSGLKTGEDTLYTFTVVSPGRERHPCTVLLPNYMKELVKAHTNREEFPGTDRFWQALCEEVLTGYVWQQAAVPPQGVLRVEELTGDLRRWIDAVLTGVG